MATLTRKKNLFEKLAPLWAFLGMVIHVGAVWYVYFHDLSSYKAMNNYDSFLKYLIWAAIIVVAVWSFVPEDITAIVRHLMFWLISGAICVAALYIYVNKYFENDFAPDKLMFFDNMDDIEERLKAYSVRSRSDYNEYYLTFAVKYTLGLCGAIAAFCAIKYKMSSSGWIKKHTL